MAGLGAGVGVVADMVNTREQLTPITCRRCTKRKQAVNEKDKSPRHRYVDEPDRVPEWMTSHSASRQFITIALASSRQLVPSNEAYNQSMRVNLGSVQVLRPATTPRYLLQNHGPVSLPRTGLDAAPVHPTMLKKHWRIVACGPARCAQQPGSTKTLANRKMLRASFTCRCRGKGRTFPNIIEFTVPSR